MKVKHPTLNQVFELEHDGTVRVDDLDTGLTGWFDVHGRPVRGDLRYADVQLLGWVGGKSLDRG